MHPHSRHRLLGDTAVASSPTGPDRYPAAAGPQRRVGSSGSGRATTLWGDGFAGDMGLDLTRVTAWTACGPDEFVRFHPRLVADDAQLPDCLADHLRENIAVRAWRLVRAGHAPRLGPLRSMSIEQASRLGRTREYDVFAPRASLLDRLGQAFGIGRNDTDRDAEIGDLMLLDHIHEEQGECTKAPPDAALSAHFAFLTGIHPAYLWASEAIAHERGATAGWLGIVARGRAAIMPLEVADYLADVIECRDARPVGLRDPVLARLAASCLGLHDLWFAAGQTRRGRQAVLRRRTTRR